MDPGPLEANKFSTRQELSRISYNRKVHCRVQKSPFLVHIRSQRLTTDPYSKPKMIVPLLLTLPCQFHEHVATVYQFSIQCCTHSYIYVFRAVSSGFTAKILYAFHLSHKHATFPAHLILLYYGNQNSISVL